MSPVKVYWHHIKLDGIHWEAQEHLHSSLPKMQICHLIKRKHQTNSYWGSIPPNKWQYSPKYKSWKARKDSGIIPDLNRLKNTWQPNAVRDSGLDTAQTKTKLKLLGQLAKFKHTL